MKKLLLALNCLFFVGCADSRFQSALSSVDQGVLRKADKPSCEMDPTDLIIHPKIISYDITSTKGGNFGFNLLSGLLKAFELNFQTKTGQVEVATSVYSPLNYNEAVLPDRNPALTIGDGLAKVTDGSFRAGIDVGQFFIGANYYWSTPFSRLTEKGLRASLTDTVTKLSSNPSRWKTVVADISNEYAIVPVGLVAGLKEGDEFAFYNVTYSWDGAPCSKLLMAVPTTRDPIAKGKVIRAEMNAAAIEIIPLNAGETVGIGTQVEISKLKASDTQGSRTLLRSVRIIDMDPALIPVVGSTQSLDLSTYANIQFRALLKEYGFYAR